jgi:hypothetical protein
MPDFEIITLDLKGKTVLGRFSHAGFKPGRILKPVQSKKAE